MLAVRVKTCPAFILCYNVAATAPYVQQASAIPYLCHPIIIYAELVAWLQHQDLWHNCRENGQVKLALRLAACSSVD